ncbi:DUF6497 family protein [Thalassorhabdomicrobium marinisediminis]|uniref:DUF6497 family protein n=1 Tax=Thalassorhabdomicrobium marinisediminis TaxID=2170577 RepID=UPI00248F60A9|nr:DUF6497 family protein [Thalassorhabdomicrobium marinisediminis]
MTIFRCDMSLLRTTLTVAISALAGGVAAAEEGASVPVPSGQPLSFLEFIPEQDGALLRFRFLAPAIGTQFDYLAVRDDFQALCDTQVTPVLLDNALAPERIVLSMSAAEIPFGEVNADVLQFFEVFRFENGTCIWEEF